MKKIIGSIIGSALIIAGLGFGYHAQAQTLDPTLTVVNQTLQSVVSIEIDKVEDDTLITSVGSGFIISHDGYIATNKHVVVDNTASYFVILSNGTRIPATVVYRDPDQDLAVVKIPGTYSSVAHLGTTSTTLGEPIIAIGNAFGQAQNSVSVGTIAGFNRVITARGAGLVEHLSGLLETHASIVPGYSGGPLFDMNGNVIGINVAASASQNNVGFSIPIESVAKNLAPFIS
jgi:serine protease Do